MTQREEDLPPTIVDGVGGSGERSLPGEEGAPIELGPAEPEEGQDRFADPDLDAIESLGRFRVERFLGAGGMGKVFRAFDRKLERAVALKLLTLPDAQAAKRFLAEARAQARVDHPNVCQVFDAGEVKGRRFIVMQLLDGKTLSKVANDLSLEQKVAVVRSVCEGVQAAHKLGLVHRDLKASNVIVVEVDGERHPYVVDFGLAREVGPGGATVTGAAAGTPWYMAPEQVAGAAVDRRTDVYALGVLLYRLLGDRYPIEGTSEVDVMLKVLTEDPEPLRRVAPRVPADLDTVVMKCLERDPARRYDSARALADDLGAWLGGEPIAARPAGIAYRLGKKLRKHRAVAALGLAAALALVAAAGYGVATRLRAAERARLAQRFGAETERLEWMLRAAYELPLHDVSAVRERVRGHVFELETTVASIGRALAGPGRFALGRGWLALDEADRAAAELARAWEGGYRQPEVALARGLAFARLYELKAEIARRIPHPDERASALVDARERYERPAAEYLAAGSAAGGAGGMEQYVAALLAFHREQWDAALVAARAAAEAQPWLYEAKLLEGTVERSRIAPDAGEAERAERYAAARVALTEAARRGESDPRAYASLCSLELDRLAETLSGSAAAADDAFDRALAACDQSLAADPGYAPARLLRLEALAAWTNWAIDAGRDISARLDGAERDARALVAARPEDPDARAALARVLETRAKSVRYAGGDPRPTLVDTLATLDAALARAPDDWRLLRGAGHAAAELAVQATERGDDPLPAFARAIASHERASAARPELALVRFDLGRAYADRAAFRLERGEEAGADLDAAAAEYERAIALKGDYPQAWNSLGVTHLLRGQHDLEEGRDPREPLSRAERALGRAIEIRPGYANPRFNLGLVHRTAADADRVAGRDPRPAMERALAAFRAGLEINPGIFFAYLEMGRIHLVGARWEIGRGGSPARDLAAARSLFARALADAPDDYMALRVDGESDLLEAEWRLRDGRPASESLARARATLARSLAANANDLETRKLVEAAEKLAAAPPRRSAP